MRAPGSSSFGIEGSNALARRIERAHCFEGSDGARQTESLHLCLLPRRLPGQIDRMEINLFFLAEDTQSILHPFFFPILLFIYFFVCFIPASSREVQRPPISTAIILKKEKKRKVKQGSGSAGWAFLFSARHVLQLGKSGKEPFAQGRRKLKNTATQCKLNNRMRCS